MNLSFDVVVEQQQPTRRNKNYERFTLSNNLLAHSTFRQIQATQHTYQLY